MSHNDASIKKIPYGVSDFEKIITGNYYYVDKTAFLRTVETAGDYLFFIRPRRFGKTLYLSLMETYYDIAKTDRFEFFFKGMEIFNEPTKEKNSYLILKFNFSMINPDIDHVEHSFLDYVMEVGEAFISRYHPFLDIDEKERINELKTKQTASDTLRFLVWLCNMNRQKVFVIIDEYDNFANTILSTSGSTEYEKLTRGEGFFKAFFNVLKGWTSGSGAPISRLFLSGVSPITLDDVTSGYNIGENVSFAPALNTMLGFTKRDVEEMLDYYRTAGLIRHDPGSLMEIMAQWYNNYRFSLDSRETLFNSHMVLNFVKQCLNSASIPEDLIDRNVRIDYGKLRHLIVIDKQGKKQTNGNFSRLREIIEEGEVSETLSKGFPLEEMETAENFTSLLFYFGLLTLKEKREGKTVFEIPNQTVKSLYYDFIIRISQETDLLNVSIAELDKLLHGMAYQGDWESFFAYISERMRASVSIRDFIRGEKIIQGFLLAYMGISDYFIVHSEKELEKGYADIVLEPFLAGFEGIKYSYIMEIKYIKKSEAKTAAALEKRIRQLKTNAEEQLNQYAGDERFSRTIGKTTLIKLVLIFCGSEIKYIGKAN